MRGKAREYRKQELKDFVKCTEGLHKIQTENWPLFLALWWPPLATDGMARVISRLMGKEGIETEHRQHFCRTLTNWKQRNGVAKQGCAIRKELFAQSCSTLCNPVDCNPPGSSVHGIFQARISEWVAISSFRGSSQPKDRTQVSRTTGRFFTI